MPDLKIIPAESFKQKILANRSKALKKKANILANATVYLSGPMDFVASRVEEKKTGWRNRVAEFLEKRGTRIYDPWNKPDVLGMPHYGKEDEFSTEKRQNWSYDDTEEGEHIRDELGSEFWPTMHIDLRMVDTADFLVSYCPTNVYSVGTVHEIIMASLQHKPILFVSPPVVFHSLEKLEKLLAQKGNSEAKALLDQLKIEAPLRPNPQALPSMWYMALLDGHYFFDGFGFARYMKEFNWKYGDLDKREEDFPPKRPLLRYLEKLDHEIPKKHDLEQNKMVENADWLVFEPEKEAIKK